MKQTTTRQKTRRAVQLVSLLAFPVTIFYMSPALPVMAAAEGILAGSLILFVLLFVTAPLAGRLFCSWLCPAGAIGDLAAGARSRRVNRRSVHWVKYLIWIPWLAGLVGLLLRSGGVRSVQIGYGTVGGLSVAGVHALIIYLIVTFLFVGLALIVGRRAGCHTICWMAPFMITGRFVGRRLGIGGLKLRVTDAPCTGCGRCTDDCPMSLPVASMVSKGVMEHPDCILCGKCVDACPRGTIRFGWGRTNE